MLCAMQLRLLVSLLFGVALVAALAPAPAPFATPLPLPADPGATCTAEAMLEVTSSVRDCYETMTHGEKSGGQERQPIRSWRCWGSGWQQRAPCLRRATSASARLSRALPNAAGLYFPCSCTAEGAP